MEGLCRDVSDVSRLLAKTEKSMGPVQQQAQAFIRHVDKEEGGAETGEAGGRREVGSDGGLIGGPRYTGLSPVLIIISLVSVCSV